jgi:hypothetical protein
MSAPPSKYLDSATLPRTNPLKGFEVAKLRAGDLYRGGPRGFWQFIRAEIRARLIEESRAEGDRLRRVPGDAA